MSVSSLAAAQGRGVVGIEVVAIGAVEGVDVPQRRMVALGDDLERVRYPEEMNVPPDSPLWKNSSSVTSLGFGVVGDEDDLDVSILRADELVEEEEEAAREVLLHRVHGSRGVHDADDDGVGFLLDVGDAVAIDEIVFVKREAIAASAVSSPLRLRCAPSGA